MEYIYDNQTILDKLISECNSWIGTPFRHKTGVKGLGCDCINFVGEVYKSIGAVKKNVKYPDYPKDWHLHQTRSLMFEEIQKYTDFDIIEDKKDLRDGDLLLFNIGKTAAHAGIYIGGYVYEALSGTSVQKIKLMNSPRRRALVKVIRLKV